MSEYVIVYQSYSITNYVFVISLFRVAIHTTLY